LREEMAVGTVKSPNLDKSFLIIKIKKIVKMADKQQKDIRDKLNNKIREGMVQIIKMILQNSSQHLQ
jgi:hypothetical protein